MRSPEDTYTVAWWRSSTGNLQATDLTDKRCLLSVSLYTRRTRPLTDLIRATAKIGQLVPLEAKPDQSDALREFLLTGYSLLSGDQEPETLQWYAVKYDTPTPTYAIIDSFAAESGRLAHIAGKVAEALIANSDTLLARGPDIPAGAFDILASKVKPLDAQSDVKKGLSLGLRVLLKAKESQVQAVREFLQVRSVLHGLANYEPEH